MSKVTLVLWVRTLKPKEISQQQSLLSRDLSLLQQSHYKSGHVTPATHAQHRSCDFRFCTFTYLRKVQNNVFRVQKMHSKLITAKVGFDEDAPIQPETHTCPTL